MKKLLLVLLLAPLIGVAQQTNIATLPVWLGANDSAKIVGSVNGLTKNFWAVDLLKKVVKYTDTSSLLSGYTRIGISYTKSQADALLAGKINVSDSAGMLSAYTRTGIAYTKAQSDAKYQIAGSYLTASDLSPYLLSATAASTYQAAGSYVPSARTLTINGTTLDLSANRSFTIATSAGSVAWGSVTGTLSGQTDLQAALNAKQNTLTAGTTGQYYRGDLSLATFPAIPAAIDTTPLGTRLTSVINATNATVATHTTQISGKQATLTTGTTSQYFRGDLSLATFPAIPAAVDTTGLGARVTANTNATNAAVATHTTQIAGKQSTLPTGSTAQYYRGDQSLATFPTIPAQFAPVAGTNISISGTYPNLTFSSSGGGVTANQVSQIVHDSLGVSDSLNSIDFYKDGNSTVRVKGKADSATVASHTASISSNTTAIAGKQNTLTLTTTGTSGAATFTGSTLNIPAYAGGSTVAQIDTAVAQWLRGLPGWVGDGTVSLRGNMTWSAAGSSQTQLTTPTLTTGTITATSIVWNWTAPTSATGYVFQTSPDNTTWTTGYTGSANTFTSTGLTASTLYYGRVNANATGFTTSNYGTNSATTIASGGTETAVTGNVNTSNVTVTGGNNYTFTTGATGNGDRITDKSVASGGSGYAIFTTPTGGISSGFLYFGTGATSWNGPAGAKIAASRTNSGKVLVRIDGTFVETSAGALSEGGKIKLRADGTNFYVDYSNDGTTWINVTSVAQPAGIFPLKMQCTSSDGPILNLVQSGLQ